MRWVIACAAVLAASAADAAEAQQRRVEFTFTPTARAQIALWVEDADGLRFATVRLTESVAYRGIGNRPGATQLNSGFRWPYGRREGVLPIWAHRRIDAGGTPFRRVLFNGRVSEGHVSNAGSPGEPFNTRDNFFCLSFSRELSGRDALDAVSCASVFNSNKGRYATDDDLARGYAEPWEENPRIGSMRPLSLESIYPPRRDVVRCFGAGCGDHGDVETFAADARTAMPEIDAVTMATPAGDRPEHIVFDVPDAWPDGAYVAWLEIHVEGDANAAYHDRRHPTPMVPGEAWDYWAVQYGYPYRAQPSVVFRVPFVLSREGGRYAAREAYGSGAVHGEDGAIRGLDEISNDPIGAPGSGVDRLRVGSEGERLLVTVPVWNVCEQPDPPPACGSECAPPGSFTCGEGLICGDRLECVGICDVPLAPAAIDVLEARAHPDEKRSHQHAVLRFPVPISARPLLRYEVRVSATPITDAFEFERALPAVEPRIDNVALTVPVDAPAGEWIDVELGGLRPETTYFVGVRAVDRCNAPGPPLVAELRTTEIHFTTVSPCFVATAAYGTPLAKDIGVLRRFRDRHLRTNAIGRALVAAYGSIGPLAARWIAGHPARRAFARALLEPLVGALR